MRPPRIRLISIFPKLVLLSFINFSPSWNVKSSGCDKALMGNRGGCAGSECTVPPGCPWDGVQDQAPCQPHASPKACPAGSGAGEGNSSRCEGTEQSSLQKCTLCTAEPSSTLRSAQLEKCVPKCLPNMVYFSGCWKLWKLIRVF